MAHYIHVHEDCTNCIISRTYVEEAEEEKEQEEKEEKEGEAEGDEMEMLGGRCEARV